MAAPLKEFVCAAHGPFEARDAKCPHGCSKRFVRQEFRTPVGTRSPGTKGLDREIRQLATDYRLPDIRTSDNGQSVMQNLRKNPTHAPSWGNVEHAAPGFSSRGEQAKTFNPGSMGVQGSNAVQPLKPIFSGPRPLLVNRPDRTKV
jgi:hypothetical protein